MDWNVKQTITVVGLVLLLVGGSALAGQALTRQLNSEHESSVSYPESRQADTARPETPHQETETDSGASSTTGELDGPHPVESVVDGDTIRIRRQGGVEALRLIGIDSPEVDSPYTEAECFGEAASERARELLEGKEVYIANGTQTNDRDRYNRLLRYVYLDENTHVNQLLIESGTLGNTPMMASTPTKMPSAAPRPAHVTEEPVCGRKMDAGVARRSRRPVTRDRTSAP